MEAAGAHGNLYHLRIKPSPGTWQYTGGVSTQGLVIKELEILKDFPPVLISPHSVDC